MYQRIVVAIVACCFAAAPAASQTQSSIQTQPRIRITGPDVIRIDGPELAPPGHAAVDDVLLRFQPLDGSAPRTIVRPGKRVTGQALGIEDGILSLRVDGQNTVRMPVNAIGRLEASEGRGRSHVLRGILVGAGTFWGMSALIFSNCGLNCSNVSLLAPIGAGMATGWWSGRRNERWTSHSVAWLTSQLLGTASP
jgi:hypothetical protein